MIGEELQNDEISLDDFNFDDLPDMADAGADVQAEETSGDFDLGDFSFDNLDVGDASLNETDDGVRKEPFFETPQEEDVFQNIETSQNEQEAVFSETIAESGETDSINGDDETAVFAEENGSLETPLDSGDIISDKAEILENDFSFGNETVEESFAEGAGHSATPNDTVEDFSVDDYLSVSEEAENTEPAVAENTFDGGTDEIVGGEETDIELSESGFVDEIPEETPVDDEISFSNEEAEEAHEEYFSNEVAAVEDTDIFAGIETSENMRDMGDYSAVSSIEENALAGYAKWYSGQSDIKMFEIAKGFDSGSFDADEECKTLHINVGYDTYGWEIQFSDGVVMNLRDVREYQIRNGRLPNSDGRVIYGHSSLLFSGVERIVIYESVKYFSYGI